MGNNVECEMCGVSDARCHPRVGEDLLEMFEMTTDCFHSPNT